MAKHLYFERIFEGGKPSALLTPFNQDKLDSIGTDDAYFNEGVYRRAGLLNKITYVHLIERAISRAAMPQVNASLKNFGGFGFDAEGNFYADYYDGTQLTFNASLSRGETDFAKERHIVLSIPSGGAKLLGTVVDAYGGETPYLIKTRSQDGSNRHSPSAAIFATLSYIVASEETGHRSTPAGRIMYQHYKDIAAAWETSDMNTFMKAVRVLDSDYYTLFEHPDDVRGLIGLELPIDPDNFNEYDLSPVDLSSIGELTYMVGDSALLRGRKPTAKKTAVAGKKKGQTLAKLIAGGTYTLGMVLTESEAQLIPTGMDDFVPSAVTLDCAAEIKASSLDPIPCRNLLWTGETGTGKTTESQLLAALLQVPYRSMNLSSDKLSSDLLTGCLPNNEKATVEDIVALCDSFPDAETIAVNPDRAYAMLTGETRRDVTESDINRAKAQKTMELLSKANEFMYVDSPFVSSFRYGGVIELQECNSCKAAILKSLNEALDDLNVIHMPTGEVVHRHRDCIVIVTANVGQGYEGINAFSNDFIARFHQADVFELPEDKVMIERVKQRSGYTEDKNIARMIKVMHAIQRVLLEAKGDYGSCSPRSLYAWARKTKNTGDAYKAGLSTIVGLATQDPEIRVECIHALETEFAPG